MARGSFVDMDVILIPGFWLDASSWEQVDAAPRRGRPHRPRPHAPRSRIGRRRPIGHRPAHHIDAVAAVVDSLDGDVVLVGHSGGGAIAHGVADARPDRIARVIYVDAGPLGEGGSINDELPIEGADMPLPAWEAFGDEDLIDLDDELRAEFRARAIPEPAAVATDAMQLSDERRYDVRSRSSRASSRAPCSSNGSPQDRRSPPSWPGEARRLRRPAHRPLAAVHQARAVGPGDRRRDRTLTSPRARQVHPRVRGCLAEDISCIVGLNPTGSLRIFVDPLPVSGSTSSPGIIRRSASEAEFPDDGYNVIAAPTRPTCRRPKRIPDRPRQPGPAHDRPALSRGATEWRSGPIASARPDRRLPGAPRTRNPRGCGWHGCIATGSASPTPPSSSSRRSSPSPSGSRWSAIR